LNLQFPVRLENQALPSSESAHSLANFSTKSHFVYSLLALRLTEKKNGSPVLAHSASMILPGDELRTGADVVVNPGLGAASTYDLNWKLCG